MENEKFKVLNYIRKLLTYIDQNLDNFPKKDIELKNRIRNESYDLLYLSYKANTTDNIEKKIDLIESSVAKAKVIDFLINMCYDKQIINSKRYLKLGEALDDIVKYLLFFRYRVFWLASRYVNCNSNNSNANFGLRNVNNSNLNGNNLFNSNGNSNNNNNRLGPVDSINCGYAIIDCIRDNIETNRCPVDTLNKCHNKLGIIKYCISVTINTI